MRPAYYVIFGLLLALPRFASADVGRFTYQIVAEADSVSGLGIVKVRIPVSDLPGNRHLVFVGLELELPVVLGESIELWVGESDDGKLPWAKRSGPRTRAEDVWVVDGEGGLVRFDLTKQIREWIAADREFGNLYFRAVAGAGAKDLVLGRTEIAVLVCHYLSRKGTQ